MERGRCGGLGDLRFGPAEERPAVRHVVDRCGQGDRVVDLRAHTACGRARGHVRHRIGGLRREDDADRAVAFRRDVDDVAVDGGGRGAADHFIAGNVVAGLGRRGDLRAGNRDRAVVRVVGNGGDGEGQIVGERLDAVVAVVRAVGPGTVRLFIIGSSAVVRVRPGAPVDDAAVVERRVIRCMDVFAVVVGLRHVLRDDDREGVARGERNGIRKRNGVIPAEDQRAGLGCHQRTGRRVAGGRILIDLDRVGKRFVPVAVRHGLKELASLCGEDVRDLRIVCKAFVVCDRIVPALAVANDVAGAVVLVVVVVVVDGLGVVEIDIALEDGGVLIGDPHIALVKITRAPAVLAEPAAVAGGLVRRELRSGDTVVPADQRDRVVRPLMGAAALRGGVDRAVIGRRAVAGIIADVACAVLHDRFLDGVDVRRGDPDGVLHVADVRAVRILTAETGAGDRARPAVLQSFDGLACRAGPAHQGIRGHFAVAALIQTAVIRRGFVAGQHAFGVVRAGVVEEAVLRLGQVQARRGGGAGPDRNFVLDHVALNARHRGVRPTGAVRVLVLDGRHDVVVAAVVARGQRGARGGFAGEPVIRLHVAAHVRVGNGARAVLRRAPVAVRRRRYVDRSGAVDPPFGKRRCGDQYKDHDRCKKQSEKLQGLTFHQRTPILEFAPLKGRGNSMIILYIERKSNSFI